jgi:hypothetical protein
MIGIMEKGSVKVHFKRWLSFLSLFGFVLLLSSSVLLGKSELDRHLNQDNADKKDLRSGPVLDDLQYLRKLSVDLIGRIPSEKEIKQFLKDPPKSRKALLVERLFEHERFADRWTAFLADMLRIRTNATGGGPLLAYVHQSISEDKPFDELARELISAQGRSRHLPAVGFILNDNADPMALTAATTQVFLGIRMQCAQCHDHPFDDWEQKDFYELASFFGKTRRVENRFSRTVYTTEVEENRVLWPPEREKPPVRKPVDASFPFLLEKFDEKPSHLTRLERKRAVESKSVSDARVTESLDSLLDETEATIEVASRKRAPGGFDPDADLKLLNASIDIKGDLYKASENRKELAKLVTHPRNRYFAQNFVNRLWAELMGRGIYEPVDDYSEYQTVSHPETLGFMRKEFVAVGYDLKEMIRLVVASDAYSRGRLDGKSPAKVRLQSELAFVAGTTRRMIGEALFDSIAVAGNLTDYKWPAGANEKTVMVRERVYLVDENAKKDKTDSPAKSPRVPVMQGQPAMKAQGGGYDLEKSIALDFGALLSRNEVKNEIKSMRMRSNEELEAMKMAKMNSQPRRRGKYKYVYKEQTVDDNPRYSSSFRMATPAAPDHFLRIFGQPGRDRLGDFRNSEASMRQALMMLNGKLTHEAARVGPNESIHELLKGIDRDFPRAVRQTYLSLFTREPSKQETKEGLSLLDASPLEGMADLRWAMLNSHEFKFIP